jgi:hypothetical protein
MSKYVDNTLVSDAEYTHIQAVKAAAATRQAAEVPGASQKTLDTAAATYFRAVVASARLNNVGYGYEPAWIALKGLTGGV